MTDLENHKLVPDNEWIHSCKELLKKEEFTILRDQLASKDEICLGWPLIKSISLMDQMGNKLYRNFMTEDAN